MLQPRLQQGNWEGGDRLGLGGKQPGAALATVVSKDLLGLSLQEGNAGKNGAGVRPEGNHAVGSTWQI